MDNVFEYMLSTKIPELRNSIPEGKIFVWRMANDQQKYVSLWESNEKPGVNDVFLYAFKFKNRKK
jgi:hypothetical protein